MASFISSLAMLGLMTAQALATSVTLQWDRNPESDVTGYHLHYGTGAGIYSGNLDAGNATSLTVPDLADGETYFFALTAYTTAGFESPFSEEIRHTTAASPTPSPTAAPSPAPTPVKGTITFSPKLVRFTGIAGGPFPSPRSITVTTSTGEFWTSFDSSPWFDAHPTTGPSGSSVTLFPHTENMAAGNYSRNIIFSSIGCPDRVAAIKLSLRPAPTPTPFKTPTPPPSPSPTCTPCECQTARTFPF